MCFFLIIMSRKCLTAIDRGSMTKDCTTFKPRNNRILPRSLEEWLQLDEVLPIRQTMLIFDEKRGYHHLRGIKPSHRTIYYI
jgi:hypothetical protein